MRTATDLRKVVGRVADRTAAYSWKCWGFGEAVTMLGLLTASQITGDAKYRDLVGRSFDRWWASAGDELTFKDHVTPGVALLLLARDDDRWLAAARALGSLFKRFPARRGLAIHRPDLDGWSSHVWVDCLYTDGPFLALLGRITGDATWRDLACAHTLAYIDVLWDEPSGLFFHGFDASTGRANAIRWGRGNGWALLGLVDLLRVLDQDHPSRSRLVDIVRRQIDALVNLQDHSGHWHTVLDRPDSYLESSVAAMMACAFPQAVRLGLVSDAALDAASRAFDAAVRATDDAGDLTGVSEATPAGDLATYLSRPTGVFPWGQGPLLLALADQVVPDCLWEGWP